MAERPLMLAQPLVKNAFFPLTPLWPRTYLFNTSAWSPTSYGTCITSPSASIGLIWLSHINDFELDSIKTFVITTTVLPDKPSFNSRRQTNDLLPHLGKNCAHIYLSHGLTK